MKRRTAAIGVLAASILFSFEVFACSYFPPSYKVGSSFTVHVASAEGSTIARVRVVLLRGNEVAYSAHTSGQGSAQFQGVATGDYSLEIDQLGTFGGDTAYVTVSTGPGIKDIKLRWPSAHVLKTTSVKGILLNSGNAVPLEDTYVALVYAIDGSLKARDMTRKTGDFDLGRPEPGLYFLKIDTLRSGDWEPRGEIPVLVANGQERDLTLAVGQTSCGMWYSELCTAAAIKVSHLAGRIVDSSGAAIERAQIELLTASGNQKTVTNTVPDRAGHFYVNDVPNGDYQLRVSAVGFGPSQIPVTVSPGASEQQIQVSMNVLGTSCAEAKGHGSAEK